MIKEIMNNTLKYLGQFTKSQRKKHGQFFTTIETGRYMASLSDINQKKISILDAGAGNGLLSAAIVEHLIRKTQIKEIHITFYETDTNILELLNCNIEVIAEACRKSNVQFQSVVINRNFITDNNERWKNKTFSGIYDIAICNPPYLKIGKEAEESKCMSDIVHGQPNLYFLFMAMAAHLLIKNGELIFIIPRSWTSGSYFKKFREYLLDNINIKLLHLFTSRDKIFDNDMVLQETMILYGTKNNMQNGNIIITTCDCSNDYDNIRTLNVEATKCLQKSKNRYVLIPTTQEELNILKYISDMPVTPKDIGFQFKTGKVVEFRNVDNVKRRRSKNTVPLIQACNLVDGQIVFDVRTDKAQFFKADKDHEMLCIPSNNTVMIKRFTSKEEKRRLQPAVYLKEQYPELERFATENHLNYLVSDNDIISECEVYGFYIILSSSIWDTYYRILNGSTQVNSDELNSMPIPDIKLLQHIGRVAMHFLQDNDNINSDEILRRALV